MKDIESKWCVLVNSETEKKIIDTWIKHVLKRDFYCLNGFYFHFNKEDLIQGQPRIGNFYSPSFEYKSYELNHVFDYDTRSTLLNIYLTEGIIKHLENEFQASSTAACDAYITNLKEELTSKIKLLKSSL